MEEPAAAKSVNTNETAKSSCQIRSAAPFHSNLSDVGLFSLGGLCAVSLAQLFDEECHREFKQKALDKILKDLGQPSQTRDSMFGIMEGELMNESHAFVDALLVDPCLTDTRQPLVSDFVALAISDGCYDSRMRMLIKHVAWQLRVTWEEVEEIEGELAETLEYNTYVMSEEEAKEKAKKSRNKKVKRYALIGLATVGGGALIGLTGGLAAPLVAAGAGAIIGGAGAAALGSAAGVAIIGSLFGVAGAGLTGYKMKRRIGAIEEFAFEPLTLIGSKLDSQRTVKQLHITIAVTGWLNSSMQDFRAPWSALAESKEQYSLRWESKYLFQLGEAFDYIWQTGINMATIEALKYTVLAGIISAIAWPAALISVAGAIDNPWHVCTQRATEAGKQLAEVLLAREQGNRPVTLIGFSLGARVVFSCLEELSKRKGAEGLIEDVIMLGAPVSGDAKNWKLLTRVVAGKIVNGYARGDWLLKFLYRTASVTFSVAGLGPVKWDNRRMHNIDLSDIIDGHSDYIKNLDTIMKAVGVRTKDELKSPIPRSSSSNPSLTSGAGVTPSSSSGNVLTPSTSSRDMLTTSSSNREMHMEDSSQTSTNSVRESGQSSSDNDRKLSQTRREDDKEIEIENQKTHSDKEDKEISAEMHEVDTGIDADATVGGNDDLQCRTVGAANCRNESNTDNAADSEDESQLSLQVGVADTVTDNVSRNIDDIETNNTGDKNEEIDAQNTSEMCKKNQDQEIPKDQCRGRDRKGAPKKGRHGKSDARALVENIGEKLGNITDKLKKSHLPVVEAGRQKFRLKQTGTTAAYYRPESGVTASPERSGTAATSGPGTAATGRPALMEEYLAHTDAEPAESCYFTDSNPGSEDES